MQRSPLGANRRKLSNELFNDVYKAVSSPKIASNQVGNISGETEENGREMQVPDVVSNVLNHLSQSKGTDEHCDEGGEGKRFQCQFCLRSFNEEFKLQASLMEFLGWENIEISTFSCTN